MGTKASQIKAVLWKAWCGRKYHYIVTILELLIPLLLIYVLVVLKQKNTSDDSEGTKIYPPYPKDYFIRKAYDLSNLDVLYTPNTTAVSDLMKKVKNKLINIEQFLPMKNESEMEKWFYQESQSNASSFSWKEGYGIVFNQLNNSHLDYYIRSTKFDVWRTNLRFPEFPHPGPMEEGANYINRGFITLQIAIDEAYMELNGITPVTWNLQEFPYPAYKRVDQFDLMYKEVLPFLLCFGYLFSFLKIVTRIGEEKESGIRESLKLSGVKPWIVYIGNIIDSGILAIISTAALTILLCADWVSEAGALLEKSSCLIIWINMFLYYILGSIFAGVLANLFTKSKYSVVSGVILWIFSFVFIKHVMKQNPSSASIFFISLIPNGYLITSISIIADLEVLGTGATFSNIFNYSERDGILLPLGCTWIASLLGMFIFFLLIVYFDAVLPGQHGVPQPWYYILPKRCLNFICRISPAKNIVIVEEGRNEAPDGKAKETRINREPLIESLPIGIEITHLYKQYGTVLALNDFSIDIYKNQITALLGHNGAGKTTLLSVITGMLPPTSGNVRTDEYDVFNNLEKFRRDLGYCPQDDLLLPDLTVAEHIIFYGMIKGLSKTNAKIKCDSIMYKCRLSDKSNTRIAELSGGMRRKLCLAVSLVNDPKILILDEPTSGLDPESRRAIWDILLELRRDRTVIITTHFMEEADVLGDRIAIMSHGELKCYGTSLFLKKNYGSGYILTILLSQGTTEQNVKQLVSVVLSEIGEATIMSESTEQITVQLPLNCVNKFPDLFDKLEKHHNLGVANLTVSCTTIDDVFQKVNEEEGVKFDVDEVDMPIPYNQLQTTNGGYTSAVRKPNLFLLQRFCAIKSKRLKWIFRNLFVTFLYVIVPMLFVVFSIFKGNPLSDGNFMDPLLLNLELYENSEVVMTEEDTNYFKTFNYLVKEQGSEVVNTTAPIIDALLELGGEDLAKFRTSMIVAGDMKNKSPTVLYSSIGIHAVPIAVNLISNTLLNAASVNTSFGTINTYNYPYTFNSDSCSRGEQGMAIIVVYTLLLTVELAIIMSYFIILVHIERTTMFKELQFLTGLEPHFYWIYTFIVDFIMYLCIFLLLMMFLIIFDDSEMIRRWNIIGNLCLIFILFGVSSLWSAYFYSFFFRTYNTSILIFIVVNLVLCIVGLVVYSILDYPNWRYVFYLNPLNPFATALFKILSEARFDVMCDVCKGEAIAIMCRQKSNTDYIEDFDYRKELYFLGFDWILYVVVILLTEYSVVSLIWHRIKSIYLGPIHQSELPLDPDILQEKARIKTLLDQPGEENPVLIVNSLAKKYSRNVTAVKDLNFAVLQGQCFGLLGTNGAGKSTTFEMLTTNIHPTKGDASIYNYSLRKGKRKYKLQIGYCPQSKGLLGELTGKETLTLFARLQGVQASELPHLVEKWIRLLRLEEFQNRPTATYSGGNLRKLSTAIALIGNPPLVFLDEPTTGVDPVTRRKIWQLLKMVQRNNQTIVITSHSMDECEALCDHLTILVKGSMQCIGNIQYLKKAYGVGYTMLIKLGIITNDRLNELKQRMITLFTDKCKLRDEHKGLLHYHHEDASSKWSYLFKNMSELKEDFPEVEDYVLSDSTLEQVFLSFASEHNSSDM